MMVCARRKIAGLMACALVLAVLLPGQAFAYFSYPAPGISVPGSVSLTSGETQSVTCAVSPMSEQQLPGCGMAECPQACDGLETPGGVVGGCMSADGWCTCAGIGYYTAYTNVTVSSSDPSVARASWAGGVLTISGYKTGSATLTVYASLSKHEPSEAVVYVNVVGGTPQADAGSVVPSDTPGGSSGGGSVSVVTPGGGAAAVVARGDTGSAASAGSAPAQVVERQAADGTRVVIVEATTAGAAVEQLERAADEGGDVTLWYGGSMDSPDISMEFVGSDLDASALAGFDPTARVSKKGEGSIAEALASAKRTVVVTFAKPGKLPATADVYVRSSLVFGDGDVVGLYRYSDDGTFTLVKDGVKVSDGYARLALDEAATYVLCDEDLTALGPGHVDASGVDATQVDTQAESGAPYLAVFIVAAVAVVAFAVAYALRKREGAE